MDEAKAMDDLDKVAYEELKNDAQIKAIIAGQKAKKMVISVNGIDIAIKAAIPKPVRDKLVFVSQAYQNGDMATADDELYKATASLCLEEPWNNPAAWKLIDEETGEVPNL